MNFGRCLFSIAPKKNVQTVKICGNTLQWFQCGDSVPEGAGGEALSCGTWGPVKRLVGAPREGAGRVCCGCCRRAAQDGFHGQLSAPVHTACCSAHVAFVSPTVDERNLILFLE